MDLPSQSTQNLYQPQLGHSNDIRTEAARQDSQDIMTAALSTAAEDDHPNIVPVYTPTLSQTSTTNIYLGA